MPKPQAVTLKDGRVVHKVPYWVNGRKTRRTFSTRKGADAFIRDLARRKELGAFAEREPSREPVVDFLAAWYSAEKHRWRPSTRKRWYAQLERWIAPYFEHDRLCDMDEGRVSDWVSSMARDGAKPRQINYSLTILSSALSYAQLHRKVPRNACRGVKKVDYQRKPIRSLMPLDVERLRVAMPKARDRLAVSLMAYAGLRPEEAFALPWSNVETGVLVIDRVHTAGETVLLTKTGHTRRVKLLPVLVEELEAARAADGLVLPNRWGKSLDLDNWRPRNFNDARDAAGVTATPYTLRHTYGSLCLAADGDFAALREQMGHRSILTTAGYTHVIDRDTLPKGFDLDTAIREARAKLNGSKTGPSASRRFGQRRGKVAAK